jgi:hypothetical protein
MLDWLRAKEPLAWWLIGLSITTFVGSLIAVTVLIVRMPADYFTHMKEPADSWRSRHPLIRGTILVLKNLLGFVLVLAGLIMSIPPIPGQGVLTILIGLSLLNFPGKKNLELRIARAAPVRNAIDWIRAKYHRPPLQIPES